LLQLIILTTMQRRESCIHGCAVCNYACSGRTIRLAHCAIALSLIGLFGGANGRGVCLFVCFPHHILATKSSTKATCQYFPLPPCQITKITCHCKRLNRLLTRLGAYLVKTFHHCGDRTTPPSIHRSSEFYVMFCPIQSR
jgi:hypothetical protein